jgi:multiple sugar transport system permease protein
MNLKTNKKTILLFLLPTAFVFISLGIYPAVKVIITSFTDYSLINADTNNFIGLSNYINMIMDKRFWSAFSRTIMYVGLSVSISLVIGLFISLILNQFDKLKNYFRVIYIIPMVISPAIIGLAFKFMYNYDFGIINHFLTMIGQDKIAFLGDSTWSMFSIILVDVWQWTPFVILVLLAGIDSLPRQPFEAAMIDGANVWQIFWHITFPLLKKFIVLVTLFRVMQSMRAYAKIQLMTEGGPGQATEVLNLYVAKQGFTWFELGYASAVAFVLLNLSAIIAYLFIKNAKIFEN